MRGGWIAVICLTVLLASNLLMPIKDVYAITTFVDSFDVSGQATIPTDVAFSADGLKMFVVDQNTHAVYEYACTTAFDVSTCGFTDSLDIALQEIEPTGIAFNGDGTIMFVAGDTADAVFEYGCTTGFDVSTCTDNASNFDISGQETTPTGIAFNTAGTKMFIVGTATGGDVTEYDTCTAFDVSTCADAASPLDVSGQDATPTGIAFNTAGTKMFLVGSTNDNVYEYACTTAFDVSTCGFTDSFDVSAQDATPTGIAFNTAGTKMFVVGDANDNVYEYTLEVAFDLVTPTSDGSRGCIGDCSPPTLGVDEQFTRVVENGFTYNGDTINVERYFTSYPLITVDVGKQNKAVFKIYDDSGLDNIRHFDFAFGLDIGQVMGTSNAMIVWNKSLDGTETVTLVDPHNALENVRVLTSEGKCKADSTTNNCLIVTVFHTFREPLDFDMVGTNVWDYGRNAWQNFYNHGIHIEGQSLNPPDEHVGIYKGNLIHLIETAKNTAVDTDGNTWTFDNTWIKDYIHKGKIDDPITSLGYDRNHVRFGIYKQGQELVASSLFEKYYKTSISQEPAFSEIDDIKFYEFPDTIDKKFDPVLLAKMHEEDIRAQKYLEELFAKIYPNLAF